MSIGARSQSARTYLEKYVNDFSDCKMDNMKIMVLLLIFLFRLFGRCHFTRIKGNSWFLPADSSLTAQNCSFGFLSKDKAFEVVEDEQVIQSYLDKLPAVVSRSVAVEESEEPAPSLKNQLPWKLISNPLRTTTKFIFQKFPFLTFTNLIIPEINVLVLFFFPKWKYHLLR